MLRGAYFGSVVHPVPLSWNPGIGFCGIRTPQNTSGITTCPTIIYGSGIGYWSQIHIDVPSGVP